MLAQFFRRLTVQEFVQLISKFWYSEENVSDFSKVSYVLITNLYRFLLPVPCFILVLLVGFLVGRRIVVFRVLQYVWLDISSYYLFFME